MQYYIKIVPLIFSKAIRQINKTDIVSKLNNTDILSKLRDVLDEISKKLNIDVSFCSHLLLRILLICPNFSLYFSSQPVNSH